MKKWIKGLGVSSVLALSVGLLAACGSGKSSSSTKTTDFKG